MKIRYTTTNYKEGFAPTGKMLCQPVSSEESNVITKGYPAFHCIADKHYACGNASAEHYRNFNH